MPSTSNLSLPLVEASQSQKHVTVNEALVGLDALSQLVLHSVGETVPPADPPKGAVYSIPPLAQAPWSNYIGQLATFSNGGWAYFVPKAGWRAWLLESETEAVFDGTGWRTVSGNSTASGAATEFTPIEVLHTLSGGTSESTAAVIPANSVLLGATGRVTNAITGSLSSWRLGVAGADDRYGSGLGIGLNSYALGLTGTPMTYYADTPLRITAEGGSFDGGEVTLVLHLLRLAVPNPV